MRKVKEAIHFLPIKSPSYRILYFLRFLRGVEGLRGNVWYFVGEMLSTQEGGEIGGRRGERERGRGGEQEE